MSDIQEQRNKREKLLKRALIFLGLILIILAAGLIFLTILDSQRSKVLLDGSEVQIDRITQNVGGTRHISIREMTKYFPAFSYNTGRYRTGGQVDQDPEYFYLESPYEVIQFKKDSDSVEKIIKVESNYYQFDKNGKRILVTKEEIDSGKPTDIPIQEIDNKKTNIEEFNLSKTLVEVSGNQFMPFEDIKYVFNLQYIKSENEVKLYTVEYLEKVYASSLERGGWSLNPNYQNRRAIIDGYFVVTKDPNDPSYGILKYENGEFSNHIALSYLDVRYVQQKQNMFVINRNNELGLVNVKLSTDIIQAGKYNTIEAYLPELELYQVSDAFGKLGVIDVSGKDIKVVVYIEYDEIGYNTLKFPEIDTGKIFFDTLIPARKDNKWFIFDLKNPGQPYGYNIKGFYDLGYKRPEVIEMDSYGYARLSDEQIEDLKSRGYERLTVNPTGQTSDAEKALRAKELAREGFVTSEAQIPIGDSVLIVPSETGFGGLVVKVGLGTDYGYQIISSNDQSRSPSTPYALASAYKSVYKMVEGGQNNYYARDIRNQVYKLLIEKPKETEKENKTETPVNNQQVENNTNQNNTNEQPVTNPVNPTQNNTTQNNVQQNNIIQNN